MSLKCIINQVNYFFSKRSTYLSDIYSELNISTEPVYFLLGYVGLLNTEVMYYYGRALSSISEGVTRLTRAGRMTCKVRRDFKIITDELSCVSLVTSNIRGSSICSPKSLYKKISKEILAELKAVVKTGALKVPRLRPVLPQSAMTYLLWQACVNSQVSPTPCHHQKEESRRTQLKRTFRVAAIIAE